MRSIRVQHVIAIGLIAALTLLGVTAVLVSWTDVAAIVAILLLGGSAVLVLDTRRRIGAQAELTRRSYRDIRNLAGRIHHVTTSTNAVQERVERAERRLLAGVESASLRAGDWQVDHSDELRENFKGLHAAVEALNAPRLGHATRDGDEVSSRSLSDRQR